MSKDTRDPASGSPQGTMASERQSLLRQAASDSQLHQQLLPLIKLPKTEHKVLGPVVKDVLKYLEGIEDLIQRGEAAVDKGDNLAMADFMGRHNDSQTWTPLWNITGELLITWDVAGVDDEIDVAEWSAVAYHYSRSLAARLEHIVEACSKVVNETTKHTAARYWASYGARDGTVSDAKAPVTNPPPPPPTIIKAGENQGTVQLSSPPRKLARGDDAKELDEDDSIYCDAEDPMLILLAPRKHGAQSASPLPTNPTDEAAEEDTQRPRNDDVQSAVPLQQATNTVQEVARPDEVQSTAQPAGPIHEEVDEDTEIPDGSLFGDDGQSISNLSVLGEVPSTTAQIEGLLTATDLDAAPSDADANGNGGTTTVTAVRVGAEGLGGGGVVHVVATTPPKPQLLLPAVKPPSEQPPPYDQPPCDQPPSEHLPWQQLPPQQPPPQQPPPQQPPSEQQQQQQRDASQEPEDVEMTTEGEPSATLRAGSNASMDSTNSLEGTATEIANLSLEDEGEEESSPQPMQLCSPTKRSAEGDVDIDMADMPPAKRQRSSSAPGIGGELATTPGPSHPPSAEQSPKEVGRIPILEVMEKVAIPKKIIRLLMPTKFGKAASPPYTPAAPPPRRPKKKDYIPETIDQWFGLVDKIAELAKLEDGRPSLDTLRLIRTMYVALEAFPSSYRDWSERLAMKIRRAGFEEAERLRSLAEGEEERWRHYIAPGKGNMLFRTRNAYRDEREMVQAWVVFYRIYENPQQEPEAEDIEYDDHEIVEVGML